MKETDVLLIDDEQFILNAIQRLMRNESFGILCTTDHEEVLKTLETEKIKVVISDQKMPEISGLDLLEIVHKKWPKIVKIIFTGYSNLKEIHDAQKSGMVYKVIEKPWDDQNVKSIVFEAIKKFDLEQDK